MSPLTLSLVLVLAAQAPSAPPPSLTPEEDKQAAAERMKEMKELAKVYTLRRISDNKDYELRPEPVLRWNNPVSGVSDGTIFVWMRDGRPALAAQIFTQRGNWMHEFVSLTDEPLAGYHGEEKVWDCDGPAMEFTKIEKAPRPATTETGRLRQMRTLVDEFSASVDFKVDYRDANTSHYELRALEKPVVRYASQAVIDGGLFAFVQGTNPEVWLLLEARQDATSQNWYYAFARMTGYAVQGKHKDQEVFNLPAWKRPTPQKGHLFHQVYRP